MKAACSFIFFDIDVNVIAAYIWRRSLSPRVLKVIDAGVIELLAAELVHRVHNHEVKDLGPALIEKRSTSTQKIDYFPYFLPKVYTTRFNKLLKMFFY